MEIIENEFYKQWINCSLAVDKIPPLQFLCPIIQGLGKLEVHLRMWEINCIPTSKPMRKSGGSESEQILFSIEMTDKFMLSYLWVLGAYEVIRTLSGISDKNKDVFGPELNEKIRKTKHTIGRLRVPLAKLEPSKKHERTDSGIAWPSIIDNCIAWQVSKDILISRRELSDQFLELLKILQKKL
jgi:hypothetical protein